MSPAATTCHTTRVLDATGGSAANARVRGRVEMPCAGPTEIGRVRSSLGQQCDVLFFVATDRP